MNHRKSQNSILVVATLGVYFGLLLAGATPQVLAQAAMARQFDVKDEIEKKDDLDTKPPENLGVSVQVYLEDIEYFLSGIRKLRKDRKFDFDGNKFAVAQATQLPCVAGNIAGSYTVEKFYSTSEPLRPSLERFSKLLTDGYAFPDCLASDKFPGLETTTSHFETTFDGSEFSVVVTGRKSSPARAALFAATLAETFDLFRRKNVGPIRASLIQNTSVTSAKDQILVVTRLPRAGLDSLLAIDAK